MKLFLILLVCLPQFIWGFTPSETFLSYIQTVENAQKKGWNSEKKLWFPHDSPEGGAQTIGYGHKIQGQEDFSEGLTDEQVRDLLLRDLSAAANICRGTVGNFDKLAQKQREMLVDFAFNLGTLKGFPKFVAAVIRNDLPAMRREYKRYAIINGKKQPLSRNTAFYKHFLSELK